MYEHMDLVMECYDKSKADKLCFEMFRLNSDSSIRGLSFGDCWALGEQLIAIKWGLLK